MPPVTRWMVRAAFVWLTIGLAAHVALAWPSPPSAAWLAGRLASVQVLHVITLGWVTQMILAVAWWMFPKRVRGGRGPESIARAWFVALNVGLSLRMFVGQAPAPLSPAALILAFAALLHFVSVAGFVALLWPRVRGAP